MRGRTTDEEKGVMVPWYTKQIPTAVIRNQTWTCLKKLGWNMTKLNACSVCAQGTRRHWNLRVGRADVIWTKLKGLWSTWAKGPDAGILSPRTKGIEWLQRVANLTDPRPGSLERKIMLFYGWGSVYQDSDRQLILSALLFCLIPILYIVPNPLRLMVP